MPPKGIAKSKKPKKKTEKKYKPLVKKTKEYKNNPLRGTKANWDPFLITDDCTIFRRNKDGNWRKTAVSKETMDGWRQEQGFKDLRDRIQCRHAGNALVPQEKRLRRPIHQQDYFLEGLGKRKSERQVWLGISNRCRYVRKGRDGLWKPLGWKGFAKYADNYPVIADDAEFNQAFKGCVDHRKANMKKIDHPWIKGEKLEVYRKPPKRPATAAELKNLEKARAKRAANRKAANRTAAKERKGVAELRRMLARDQRAANLEQKIAKRGYRLVTEATLAARRANKRLEGLSLQNHGLRKSRGAGGIKSGVLGGQATAPIIVVPAAASVPANQKVQGQKQPRRKRRSANQLALEEVSRLGLGTN